MKKIFTLAIAAASIVFGFASCNCDDIGWKPQEPCSQIQGKVVVNKPGGQPAPMANADITVEVNGKTYMAKTDANGHYLIEEIEPGDAVAAVTIAEEGLHGYSKHVKIEKGAIASCNFILTRAVSEVTHTKIGHDDVYQISLPDVIQENKEVVQIATYYIPEGTLRNNEVLELEAWYELRPNVYKTKARTQDEIVIPLIDDEGFHYTGDNIDITVFAKTNFESAEALQLFKIDVKDLMTPICVVHQGVEVDVVHDDAKQVSSFNTKIIGKTVLTYPIYVKEMGDGTEPLTFDPAEYYSKGGWTRIYSKYFMKYVEYDWAVQTPSILWQYAVLVTGWFEAGEYQYYSTMVNVPKGETIVLSGWQHYQLTRFKCGWAKVDVKIYDQIYMQYKDRKHTGGSN